MLDLLAVARRDPLRAAEVLACLPDICAARQDQPLAQTILKETMERLGEYANHADGLMVNMLFIHAAVIYGNTWGDNFYTGELLPRAKGIVQSIISAQMPGARMDDGGLLWQTAGSGNAAAALVHPNTRLNAYWIHALEALADRLHKAGDRTGDHFERLAGRFRRSFAKTFWCEMHGTVCPPERRTTENHGIDVPEADGLLFVRLEGSPTPKTKQRQIVNAVRKAANTMGVRMSSESERVSPMHLAWLAEAYVACTESPGAKAEGGIMLKDLARHLALHPQGLPRYFEGDQAGSDVDLATTAEVHRVLVALGA